MDPITQRARALLGYLNDERIEQERAETDEMVRKHITGERNEWHVPENCEPSRRDDEGLSFAEQARVKAWMAQSQPATQPQETVSREWVQAQLDVIVDVIAEETASDNEKICAAIRSLKEQVAALRGEVDVLRGIARGEIASIASKGKTSDAA